MTLTQRKEEIKEFIEAREKCKPGPVVMGSQITENDLMFCIQAMSVGSKIAEDLLVALEALEKYAPDFIATKALSKILGSET